MDDWTTVLWTDARHLAIESGLEDAALPDEGMSPKGFFEMLRSSGRESDAITVMAMALPRLDAISWAVKCVSGVDENRSQPEDQRRLRDLKRLTSALGR